VSNTDDIRQFMETGEHPVRDVPTADIPDWERVLRAKLVLSEALEFVEAMGCGLAFKDATADRSAVCRAALSFGIEPVSVLGGKVDLVEAADACADLRYVVIGSEITLGIPGDAVFDEVHRSNMTKFLPDGNGGFVAQFDADRKVVKPPTWEPPDIASVLMRAGWEG